MSKHTLEQVLEHLINKEDGRASELLHQFFVAKGKSIYEELSQFDEEVEDELEEGIGGAPQQDFQDEVIEDEADLENERLFSEADDEEQDPMAAEPGDEPTEPEATADLAMGGEEGEEAGEGSPEDKAEDLLQDVDSALAELKAIFAELTGGTAGGEEGEADMGAMGGEEPTEEGYQAFGEATSLMAVAPAKMGDNGQNNRSPVSSGPKVGGNGAKAVNFTGQADGKGGTEGGLAKPTAQDIRTGNVGTVAGNKKAPALKAVPAPKAGDNGQNTRSPVAKS